MNGHADIRRNRSHFDREPHFGDEFPGVGADDSAADDTARLL
jgi:hypothetical protein